MRRNVCFVLSILMVASAWAMVSSPAAAQSLAGGGGFSRHTLGVRSDGTVAAWGHDGYGQVSGASSVTDAVYTVAGAHHSYAVLRNGSITSWGRNTDGQGNTPAGFELPTTVRWTGATSGDYLASHMWDGRIPSTALSTAVFDQSSGYTVRFNNTAMAAGLNIDAGNVDFDLGNHQYQVGGDVSVGSGALFMTNGMLTAGGTVSNNGLIVVASGGQLSASSIVNNGTIAGDLALVNGESLSGNGHFAGTLAIANGATLAPGNSVGLMTGIDAVWGGGGGFDFEINDALGTFGGSNGWDALDLTAFPDCPLWVIRELAGSIESKTDDCLPQGGSVHKLAYTGCSTRTPAIFSNCQESVSN